MRYSDAINPVRTILRIPYQITLNSKSSELVLESDYSEVETPADSNGARSQAVGKEEVDGGIRVSKNSCGRIERLFGIQTEIM
jgi:hypothetical protein